MSDGRHSAPRGRSNKAEAAQRALANEHRLVALGEAVDRKSGIEPKRRRDRHHGRHRRRNIIISAGVVVGLLVVLLGGGYLYAQYRFNQIPKINVPTEAPVLAGKPFNILEIGSDSRVGLTAKVAAETGASSVSGQRSDVVKIMHVDPAAGTITVLSIPRDTMTTLLANQSLFGKFNRINVNFGKGPSLLARTITANFGIPINHVIVVSFGGLINAANAIGGVYLDFKYPTHDPASGLVIRHPGCQLVSGFQALAVARSRHYYYNVKGLNYWPRDATLITLANSTAIDDEVYNDGWMYDGTSDFGRIDRQNAFMRAMINRVRGTYNPLTINSFLSKIPQGITLDSKFTLGELVGLAIKFHGINPSAMLTDTLPTTSALDPAVGSVLFVAQPAAQKMLVNIFGSQLLAPTNPPPNTLLETPMPPVVTATKAVPVPKTKTGPKKVATTTTTNPSQAVPNFDPVPCTP
jgi:LCP family protein required for cell wall assembly